MPEKPIKMEPQKVRKDSEKTTHRRTSGNFPKKKDKFGRKRSQSFTGGNGKFCTPYKCRKRPVLPTKFLLGGNICDPLNLNSLQDEETNRTVNAITPKSSPIPTPPQRRGHIEVIIPPNIHDPLNLINCTNDVEYEQQLTSPFKKNAKRRKKKKRTSSATTEVSDADISSASEAKTPDKNIDSAKIPDIDTSNTSTSEDSPPANVAKVTKDLKLELSPQKDKKRKSFEGKEGIKKIRRLESMDKIVSPVVPQPGGWLKRPVQLIRSTSVSGRAHMRPVVKNAAQSVVKMPDFKPKNKAYQYGNYNRYYGYRNPNHEVDPRLKCFVQYRYLFFGKDILDIGCNIGHITLTIARDFGAKSIVGLDIDKKLIGIARKNIRHYVNCCDSPRSEKETDGQGDKFFPISMPILYGPVDVPGMTAENKGRGFPHNVTFVQGNYVLADDTLLSMDQTQFDVILCLSVTKWMHLNWGDSGLKQAFKRMYAQLRPGGKLILEPQSWASYKHKKTLTETIYKNYTTIEFFPEKFTQYLLSTEVGFAKSEIMGHPHHFSKGFQRPIQIFTKSDTPSHSQRSYTATPSHTITSGSALSKPVYSCLASPFHTYEQEPKEEVNERIESSETKLTNIIMDHDGKDINTQERKIEKKNENEMQMNVDKCKANKRIESSETKETDIIMDHVRKDINEMKINTQEKNKNEMQTNIDEYKNNERIESSETKLTDDGKDIKEINTQEMKIGNKNKNETQMIVNKNIDAAKKIGCVAKQGIKRRMDIHEGSDKNPIYSCLALPFHAYEQEPKEGIDECKDNERIESSETKLTNIIIDNNGKDIKDTKINTQEKKMEEKNKNEIQMNVDKSEKNIDAVKKVGCVGKQGIKRRMDIDEGNDKNVDFVKDHIKIKKMDVETLKIKQVENKNKRRMDIDEGNVDEAKKDKNINIEIIKLEVGDKNERRMDVDEGDEKNVNFSDINIKKIDVETIKIKGSDITLEEAEDKNERRMDERDEKNVNFADILNKKKIDVEGSDKNKNRMDGVIDKNKVEAKLIIEVTKQIVETEKENLAAVRRKKMEEKNRRMESEQIQMDAEYSKRMDRESDIIDKDPDKEKCEQNKTDKENKMGAEEVKNVAVRRKEIEEENVDRRVDDEKNIVSEQIKKGVENIKRMDGESDKMADKDPDNEGISNVCAKKQLIEVRMDAQSEKGREIQRNEQICDDENEEHESYVIERRSGDKKSEDDSIMNEDVESFDKEMCKKQSSHKKSIFFDKIGMENIKDTHDSRSSIETLEENPNFCKTDKDILDKT